MINSLRVRYDRILKSLGLFDSGAYWSARYRRGETSGSGSYGENARYKADFLNGLVQENAIKSVIEFGCGDGAQAEMFTFDSYTGVDVTQEAVDLCKAKQGHRHRWCLHNLENSADQAGAYDRVLSPDVVHQLVKDPAFDGDMNRLFDHAGEQVPINSSDHEEASTAVHMRHRTHSDWKVATVFENPRSGQSADSVLAFSTFHNRRAA